MYVVTSIPFVSRTRATFRSAEFGFLGVEVYTRVQTPRFCGQLFSAGLEVLSRADGAERAREKAGRSAAVNPRDSTATRRSKVLSTNLSTEQEAKPQEALTA